ncbi:speckle-type POZ protein-like [Convolutriloba macropyga]|uniref:speckle-type POZ protein-like n=1 Tax=Convolutriloba macropyga TaxID=536237 RepID=UPI003F51DB45
MNCGQCCSLKRCHSLDANEHYVSKRSVKCHSVLWSIENFSVCLHDEKLESPIFEFAGVRWASHIYPKGMVGEPSMPNNYVQVFVKVIQFSSNQTLKFEIAIVDKDGNPCFTKKTPPKRLEGANQFGVCFKKFMSHEYLSDTDKYAPNDVLTVHHKIILISESETSKLECSSPKKPCVDARLYDDWEALYKSGQSTDFQVVVDSKEIQTHKAVLVARSPVFRAMLAHPNTAESTSGRITIDDCKYGPFQMFLKYLYTGNLFDTKLDDRTALDLITIANKYDVPGLKAECQNFLKTNITVENAAEVLIIADMHGCSSELINTALDFIKKNSEAVKSQSNWKSLVEQHSHIFIDHFV